MTNEAKERAIRWLTEEVRSLRMAPKVNGCKPDNWAESLEIMETCLEAVRDHFPDAKKMMPLTMEQLREMGGQPVLYKRANKWFIVELHHPDFGECIIEQTGYFIPLKTAAERGLYAYPPAHIDMEAWVRVEDRLPDDNERVIAYRPNEADVSAYKYCVMWGWSVKMSMKHRGISHWMPLPEPPAKLEKRLRG